MRPSASVAGPVWPGHASKREDISGPLSRSLRPSSSIQHSLSLSPHSPLLSAAVISPACPPPPPRRICRASERARAYFDDVAPGAQECRRRRRRNTMGCPAASCPRRHRANFGDCLSQSVSQSGPLVRQRELLRGLPSFLPLRSQIDCCHFPPRGECPFPRF